MNEDSVRVVSAEPVDSEILKSATLLSYRALIARTIEQHWQNPYCEGADESVEFTIGPEGGLEKIRLDHSSGSSICDQAAIESIEKSRPMPFPPEGLMRIRLNVSFKLSTPQSTEL